MRGSANRLEAPQQDSFHTCEVCGQPGELREAGRIKTLRDEHDASGQEVEDHGRSNTRATLAGMPAEAFDTCHRFGVRE